MRKFDFEMIREGATRLNDVELVVTIVPVINALEQLFFEQKIDLWDVRVIGPGAGLIGDRSLVVDVGSPRGAPLYFIGLFRRSGKCVIKFWQNSGTANEDREAVPLFSWEPHEEDITAYYKDLIIKAQDHIYSTWS